ncbi:ribose-phosphate diphosphokinase [Bifidobacterium simiarum]|uniref:ribose-phosphate diphosphokinase n=1 Tax=Bifidobacterium simiarum TaxID=2045441 RepID=UPI0013FD5AAD|nr:ribose-phosphate diphosphokinase [Bifidobacterium simiarum]MBT1165282.1 ribose-phosphate diphosphokinase [Bifidobacterium simiarum]
MSAILEGKPDKNLILVTGRAHPKLAADVADQLGIDVLETTAYDFANGEMYVRYTESVRGADVFVLQSHTTPINKWIMEQLIMIDAAKRASARSITAVCPMLGYSRQDKKHRGREPISCRLIFDLLATAGADRVMSVDLHAAQSQGFFDGPVDHLIAMPVLVDYVRDRLELDNVIVVSPDAGRIKVAEQWAQRLGGGPLAFVHKTRDITRPNQAVANRVVGDVRGKDCVLVDDLIDTAGTIAGACKVLKEAGAKSITVAATHGVLSDPAVERLKNCGAREVVLTDTVPIPQEKRWDGLTVLSIAPLLASAIREVFNDGSVAELFDTYPTHHGQGFLFA